MLLRKAAIVWMDAGRTTKYLEECGRLGCGDVWVLLGPMSEECDASIFVVELLSELGTLAVDFGGYS
jgi:hypothetical protein